MSTLKTNAIQTIAGKPILNSTGSILQVVSATIGTSTITTTSTSYQSSGYSVTITPGNTSSKILVSLNGGWSFINSGNGMYLTLYRGATDLGGGAPMNQIYSSTNETIATPLSMLWLDSPATTSASTYTLYFRSRAGASVNVSEGGATFQMIAMEVAA